MDCRWNTRTEALLGREAMDLLHQAVVAVVGLGGVGGACAEALLRAGIGTLILMDHDNVDVTNCNRQLFATADTVGMPKAEAARKRLLSIRPDAHLEILQTFYSEETEETLFHLHPHFIGDAIDTVTSKLRLASECRRRSIPLIQCLGTGNRLDPSQFRIGTIEDTAGCGCGLARVMRKELRRRSLTGQTVVYSLEPPRNVSLDGGNGRHSPASISFCPPAAGYLMASWIVREILEHT